MILKKLIRREGRKMLTELGVGIGVGIGGGEAALVGGCSRAN